MKRYSTGEVICRRTVDGMDSEDWVPADVAQGLYEALVKAKGALPGHNWGAVLDIDDALAAADGEDV